MAFDDIMQSVQGGLDSFQQGVSDVFGGVPEPQADAVARKLLGDEMVDQYGDVLGTRRAGVKDIVRDFLVGFQEGPDKVNELRKRARDEMVKAYDREREVAAKKFEESRQKSTYILDAVKQVQTLSPKYRAGALKELLAPMGIEPPATVLKMFTDAEIIADMPLDVIYDGVNSGKLGLSDITAALGSTKGGIDFVQQMSQIQKNRAQLSRDIVGLERDKVSLAKARSGAGGGGGAGVADANDANAKARMQWFKARLGTMKVQDPNDPLNTRPATADEVAAMAWQAFPRVAGRAPSVPNPLAAPRGVEPGAAEKAAAILGQNGKVRLPQKPSTTTPSTATSTPAAAPGASVTSTSTSTGPGGFVDPAARQAAPPAPAAPAAATGSDLVVHGIRQKPLPAPQ